MEKKIRKPKVKQTYNFEDTPSKEAMMHLADGTRLEWVPTWEGVLLYAPDDIILDSPLRFWHVLKSSSRFKGRTVRIQLKRFCDYQSEQLKLMPRYRIHFKHCGKDIKMYCNYLTMHCLWGFTIADRQHWVVDHINGVTLDDRPSNLQVISQRENLKRSKANRANITLTNEQRKAYRQQRIEARQRRIEHLLATTDESWEDIQLRVCFEMRAEIDAESDRILAEYEKKKSLSLTLP